VSIRCRSLFVPLRVLFAGSNAGTAQEVTPERIVHAAKVTKADGSNVQEGPGSTFVFPVPHSTCLVNKLQAKLNLALVCRRVVQN
jgi:hypothetical protein